MSGVPGNIWCSAPNWRNSVDAANMLATMQSPAAAAAVAFTSEERGALLAFKNVVQNLQSSLSIARAIECRERQMSNDARARLARGTLEKFPGKCGSGARPWRARRSSVERRRRRTP